MIPAEASLKQNISTRTHWSSGIDAVEVAPVVPVDGNTISLSLALIPQPAMVATAEL